MIEKEQLKDIEIGVIGLGYVGLPLAVEFGRKRSVVGFDIGSVIIAAIQENILIKGPPIMKTTIRDVITDKPVRNVKYLKTFKNEY